MHLTQGFFIVSYQTTDINQIEIELARAEGELLSLRTRILEILHLISETAEMENLNHILIRRMETLVQHKAKCESQFITLKNQLATERAIKI